MNSVTIGARGSPLALKQANMVASALGQAYPGLGVRIKTITTTGDRILDVPLSKIGDKGLFVKELEAALLDGEIDLAVHSAKDLPSQLPEGLTLSAFLPRGDARDTLVLPAPSNPSGQQGFDALPPGARVGTSSLRRICQLRAARPDLHIEDIRGNVDTRLRKLASGQFDALVLAAAGLERLGLIERVPDGRAITMTLNDGAVELIAAPLPVEAMLPAGAQGTLALECRAGDTRMNDLLSALDDAETRIATLAERSFLRSLEGGCQAPIAAYARVQAGRVHLTGLVGSLDGTIIVKRDATGATQSAELLGRRLAEQVLIEGGRAILAGLRNKAPSRPLEGVGVIITRAESRATGLASKLSDLGATPILYPVIAYAPPEDAHAFDAAMQRLMRGDYDWLALTSATGVEAIHEWLNTHGAQRLPGVRVAAVGAATAQACADLLQQRVAVAPDAFNATALAGAMGVRRDERILLLNADIAQPTLQDELARAGAQVERVIVYRTTPATALANADVDLSAMLTAKAAQAVLFTSGSTVRHFVERLDPQTLPLARNLFAVCIGPSTAGAAREAGFTRVETAAIASEDGLIEALVQAFKRHTP